MTDIGHESRQPAAHVAMMGMSVAGEILAGRYRLEEHISDDSRGRQVWRGLDVVLRRPIAVVLRHPGGHAAGEMMSAAVAASRITHPHLVDVYDAIDEGTRAYVVREWVDGAALRELVADGPLDAGRATAVAHAVASAVAAAHATNMVHGNVQPGTVLIADDGRVVLADARADSDASMERDIRAIGGVLYAALTGYWPHAELGPDRLIDGVRDADGLLASPRQVRGGVPPTLSDLAMDLLDSALAPPSAEALAMEFARLDTDSGDEFFDDGGPLGFVTPLHPAEPDEPGRSGRKLAVGVAALLVLSAAALVVTLKLAGDGKPSAAATPPPTSTSSTPANTATQPGPIALLPSQVRIVDPPHGNREELDGASKMVDGDESTGWETNWYNSPAFGLFKPGMGVLIDLGKPTNVANVKVDFDNPGATVSVRVGDVDPGNTSLGDQQIYQTYHQLGPAVVAGSSVPLPVGQTTRFVLVWISKLPPAGSKNPGKFQVQIDEITVNGG
ncbi:MAG TPA: protein kinase family protein [Micromonosporaceae bacterium]|nr:protein kinase family protein [Micromonosporaceae bacterium]